jgi:dipeptidyl aminopeptidase/acylaminoacyl peptidase
MSRVLVLLVFTATGFAQTAQLSRQLAQTVTLSGVAISPDAAHVAWTQTIESAATPATFIATTSGGSRPIAVGTGTNAQRVDSDPAWSPDSKMLAFFSTAGEKDQPQLWTVAVDGTGAKKRSELIGYAARPHWSHDGKQIAFLFIEGAGGGGPLLAAPAMTGVIDEKIHNQRIAILDTATDHVRFASPANLHVYDFDWSPDDRSFVATAAPGPGDNNWWIAQLYTISRGQATSIYKPELQIAIPRWSPDGKTIAFIEGLMSDEGFHGGDVFTVPVAGGQPVNRTKDRAASASSLFWLGPDRLLLTEEAGGGSAISELSLMDGSIKSLWQGPESIHSGGNFPNFDISRGAKMTVAARSSFEKPPEIWAGPIGHWRQITHLNDAQRPAWGRAESLEWTNDGFHIQGWLLAPREVQPGKNYPLVVVVHGGPSNSSRPSWPEHGAFGELLSSQGYYVLLPNPRGSYGQGEAFTRANVKDLGGGDLRDILTGVDAALAGRPIDPQRIGITGWSYGGFMTMFAVTQTDRFKAAMAGAGIADWESYYGENLIDKWMIPFFGASVYDDPAAYAKSSAINFIRNVKTPTLIQVGEHDAECPSPQSFEFWHALRALEVPTELIVYAGEGHMFVKPEHAIAMQDHTVAWFDKYLKR